MLKYTLAAKDKILGDFRKFSVIFKYLSLIYTIGYFIYVLSTQKGIVWVNIVLSILFVGYTIFEILTYKKQIKSTKKIIDTVGRIITFDYTNPLQTVVTIAENNDTNSSSLRTIKYNKTLMNSDGDYVLSSVEDSEGYITKYKYNNISANKSVLTKDPACTYTHYCLNTITKPSGYRIFLKSATRIKLFML